ncbi:MAG: HNH endonuclease [Bacilli bacterium]|nr:HNH endonuclease [Bacilli bacterium]
MNCLNCGKPLKRKKVYCNNICQKEYEYKRYICNWQNGIENGMKGKYQISNYVRKYLFMKYGNKCSKCGWGERNVYSHVIPLEIDHIDGNYLNNSESNLILLCPNCHSLTSTYKGANRGKGRKDRKKYSLYDNPELG